MLCRLALPLALIALFVAPTDASAAERNSLHEGAWGLEFEVQPRLSGYYGGAGIAVKRLFTDRSAARLGVLVAINSADTDGTRMQNFLFPYDTLTTTSKIVSYSDRRDVSLFLHVARYLGVGSRFGMMLEAGPTARWISEEYGDQSLYPGLGGVFTYAIDHDEWLYGLDLQTGFEWFFTRRLSLAGRYGITALVTDADDTRVQEYYDPRSGGRDSRSERTHSDGFIIQTTPAVLSLTGYW